MTIKLAENIRAFRKARKMTQEQLAETLGVTIGAVSKWEAAQSTPELTLIIEMARLFETSVDVLLGYEWHKSTVDEFLTRIKALRNEKRFDEAIAEAEKALQKYPNNFKVVFGCAVAFSLAGIEKKNKRFYQRALTLFERALELIEQNDNPEINEWTIRNAIANVYAGLGQTKNALELLKKNNADGLNNADIGFMLATTMEEPDEALEYLSNALVDHVTSALRVTGGYANAFEQKKMYAEQLAILNWALGSAEGLCNQDAPSYMDRMYIALLIACAESAANLGDEAAVRDYLTRTKEATERFDANPCYGFNNMRFFYGNKAATGFDDFGETTLTGIEERIRENKIKPAADILMRVWEEIC